MTPAELRQRREVIGLSQKRLADHLGVDKMTVWKWEAGQHAIPGFLRLALDRLADELAPGRR